MLALMSSRRWLRSGCRDVIIGSPLKPSCFGVLLSLRISIASPLSMSACARRQWHEVEKEVDGMLRFFRGCCGKGIRLHANHVLPNRLAKLQCRGEKLRRTENFVCTKIHEPTARFSHDGLTDGIQRVQSAIRVVFPESPQGKRGCQLGLDALEQRQCVQTALGHRRRARKQCGASATHSDTRRTACSPCP